MSRDKQEKFAGVQKLAERKQILQETVSRAQKESAKLANEVQPIKDKVAKKESEVREKIDRNAIPLLSNSQPFSTLPYVLVDM
jgi:predicted RNase H-like nuclease (RuvC/YqgF family)